MSAFALVLVGTMSLVILGDGVVANVWLTKAKGRNSGWIVITAGWALGVAVAVYSVSKFSNAHLNPAVTIGLAAIGNFPWPNVVTYVTAQLIGALLGGFVVWMADFPHWKESNDPDLKLA